MKYSIHPNLAKYVGVATILLAALGIATVLLSMDRATASSATQSAGSVPVAANYSLSDARVPVVSQADTSVGFTNGTMTVTRSASVAVEPDHAILNLGVEGIASTVASARQTAAERMTAVLEAVKQAGVAEDDIATTMFEIAPETEWIEEEVELANGESLRRSRSRIVGYAVRNGIEAIVRDLDTVGDVIDAAAIAAGDTFRVPRINFSADDQATALDQARRVAAADARRVAQLYANSLGFILGPVVEMVEYGTSPVLRADFEAAAQSGYGVTTPIIPGDLDVSATVEVSFAILGATLPLPSGE